jgi:peptide-methionine (S)-S-oxide reductase
MEGSQMMEQRGSSGVATLGGGCFWCLDPVYTNLVGVKSVTVGYAGGSMENPTYQQVTTGTTGHAEVAQIEFDPQVIEYEDLLNVFFSIHDPTTPNQQGADVGPQYRSIVLVHDPEQEEIAKRVISKLEEEARFPRPIVTEVKPFEVFYPAEEYHQSYFKKNPFQGYCQMVIAPKVAKFRKQTQYQLQMDGSN